jgi:hypothetical protein
LVNIQGIQNGDYINKNLSSLSVNELIELAEKYCGEQNYQSAIMKKILEQIQKEKMQTEYNRTEV